MRTHSSFEKCISRIGESIDGLEPCYIERINSRANFNKLLESKGWGDYRWIVTERGRSLVLRNGDPKQPDISIAKFGKGTREVGRAHSTA